jgi:hypothetical protein
MTDTTTSTATGDGDAGKGSTTDGAQQGDGKNQQQTGDRGGSNSQTGAASQGASDRTFTQADVDRIVQERLNRAKQQHDADVATARDNATKPLQNQLDELRKSLSDRDSKDVERNGKLALAAVHTLLAEAGINKSDVADVLEPFDPKRLLKDGEPDDKAIEKFARGLSKVAGRITPDLDQGQGGSGDSPQTMGDVMRQMARNRR